MSEPHDVEFDGGATFLEPVPCALSADVDGEFKSELQGARERGSYSLRCWPEKTEQFHDPQTGEELHGRRRRGGENNLVFSVLHIGSWGSLFCVFCTRSGCC